MSFFRPASLTGYLLLAALLTGCSEQEAAEQTTQESLPVHLLMVNHDARTSSRNFVGQVDAVSTVDLAFQVGGRLTELPVQPGQILPAGQLLAALDPADYQSALDQAEVAWQQAERNLERGRQLQPQNFVSRSDMDQLETAHENARLGLENARRNLGYTRLEAPFDALITRRLVERFATVAAGTPILRIQNVSELRVHIQAPEHLIRDMSGSPDQYLIQALLGNGSDRHYQLSYREHATEVDPATQTYRITLGMPRPQDVNLLPGMSLTVRVQQRDESQAAFWIPLSALDTSTPGQFRVWRYNPESSAVEQQQVEVGAFRQNQVQVLSGLNPGSQIVTAGLHQLQPGKRVHPFNGY